VADAAPATSAPRKLTTWQKLGIGTAIAAAGTTATLTLLPEGPKLYEIHLGPGDHPGVNIDWITRNGAPILNAKTWMDDGDDNDPEPDDYDGVAFIGAGVDVTHIRCTSWDGITIAVKRQKGIVRFENLTVHSGYDRGSAFGEQNLSKQAVPGFRIELVNVKGLVDPPETYRDRRAVKTGQVSPYDGTLTAPGSDDVPLKAGQLVPHDGTIVGPPRRPKWMWFAYNADLYARNVETLAREAVEHGYYWHGFSEVGMDLADCYTESGAEGVKARCDALETAWTPNAQIFIRRCEFRDWFQVWSWRGGAAIVMQGTGAKLIYIEHCLFWGGEQLGAIPANMRSKCVMISAEGASYDAYTGAVGTGFGNGIVAIVECAFVGGGVSPAWHNTLVRVGTNGGTQMAAKRVYLVGSALYGDGYIASIGNVPDGRTTINGCNTPTIKAFCDRIGMSTAKEAVCYLGGKTVPLSQVHLVPPTPAP
jgi:hypothetical protein